MKFKNKDKTVIIYKHNELLAQFPTIKKAAHFMKTELGRERITWSIINKGIQENISYTHKNGTVYSINQLSEPANVVDLKKSNHR
jgi:hypothetical protein